MKKIKVRPRLKLQAVWCKGNQVTSRQSGRSLTAITVQQHQFLDGIGRMK